MINNRKEKDQSTEQAILAAAEWEFMTKGFAAARTTSIAAQAGVTHAMLHYYFRTKEALFDRIIRRKISEMLEVVMDVLKQESTSFLEKIIEVLRMQFEFVKRNPLLPAMMLGEAAKDPESSSMNLIKSNISREIVPLITHTISQLQQDIKNGNICNIDITALFTDILSLNIVSVAMSRPLAEIFGMTHEEFLTMRLEENIETIKRRLKP